VGTGASGDAPVPRRRAGPEAQHVHNFGSYKVRSRNERTIRPGEGRDHERQLAGPGLVAGIRREVVPAGVGTGAALAPFSTVHVGPVGHVGTTAR
jgi:hypothetical protein